MHAWWQSSLGQALLADERRRCETLLPAGYYPYSLQVGIPALDFAANVETGHRFIISNEYVKHIGQATGAARSHAPQRTAKPSAISDTTAMPFADKTHNLIFLPHTLDFCPSPHAVLREVNQILVPEGCVVITGFNLFSLWSGVKLFRGSHNGHPPWGGHFYRLRRVQDWLSLLGIDVVAAGLLGYLPPLQRAQWRTKLAFLEHAGARWWPALAAVYVLVGRKRELSAPPAHIRTLRWQRLIPTLPKPAVQPAARTAVVVKLSQVTKR